MVLGEGAEVVRIGAVPRVDRLVRIAHHAQVGTLADPRRQQVLLQGVDVLELVHEEVTKPPMLGGRELAVVEQVAPAESQQVVEVDHSPLALALLVTIEELGDG